MIDNEEIIDSEHYFSLPNHKRNWLRLKEWYWDGYFTGQTYFSEAEQIFLVEKEDQRIALGYVHGGRRPIFPGEPVLDKINKIKDICSQNKWSSYELILATDFFLEHLYYGKVKKLPNDISYLIIETNDEGKPEGPKFQNILHEIERSYFKTYEYISKIRNRRRDDAFNDEDSIMRAISNGDGDLFGL